MKKLLVLGAGTAGTMIVNRLRSRLESAEWNITVVDQDDVHHYQPGYLFLPFGTYTPDQVTRSRHTTLPDGVDFVLGDVDRVDAAANTVVLTDGRPLGYDYLVTASGTTPRPDQTPGIPSAEWPQRRLPSPTSRPRLRSPDPADPAGHWPRRPPGRLAQLVRASPFQGEGRGFESLSAHEIRAGHGLAGRQRASPFVTLRTVSAVDWLLEQPFLEQPATMAKRRNSWLGCGGTFAPMHRRSATVTLAPCSSKKASNCSHQASASGCWEAHRSGAWW